MTTRRAMQPQLRIVDLAGIDCAAYTRVSTEDQATDDKTSLGDQDRAIRAAAARRGVAVGAWFCDAGVSGATMEGRPEFRALIASCEASPRRGAMRGTVLVLNDSRWGRFPNPEEATYWRVHLEKLGWDVRFAEGDDVEDTLARGVMRFIGAAQASEYRIALQRNTRRGMKGTAEQGLWSRREPYGYRRQVVIGRARILERGERKADGERVALVPDPVEAAIVRQMFARYADGGCSLRSLYRWAVAHAPGRQWSIRAVQIILTNRTYVGDVVSGRRCADPVGYGKQDAHPAIIDRALFARVQERLADNKRRPVAPARAWMLSGLVRCPHCGMHYVAGGLGSTRADGTRTRFYADQGGENRVRRGKVCPGPMGTVSQHLLEDAVLGTIAGVLRTPSTQRRLAAAVDRFLAAAPARIADETATVSAARAKAQRRRDALVEALADRTISQQEAAPLLAAIRTEIETLEARRQQLAFDSRRTDMPGIDREALLRMAINFPIAVRQVAPAEAREIVRPWLASAEFDKISRTLTIAVRRVPAIPPLLFPHPPGLRVQGQDVVVRKLVIGGRSR